MVVYLVLCVSSFFLRLSLNLFSFLSYPVSLITLSIIHSCYSTLHSRHFSFLFRFYSISLVFARLFPSLSHFYSIFHFLICSINKWIIHRNSCGSSNEPDWFCHSFKPLSLRYTLIHYIFAWWSSPRFRISSVHCLSLTHSFFII